MTQFNVRGSVSLSVSARLLDYRWSSDYLGKRISAGPLAQLWMPFSNRFGMVLGATLRVGTLTVGGTEGDPSSVAAEVGLTASFYAGRF
jgi:hypothetical protein